MSTKVVLVVDDDPALVAVYGHALRAKGFDVLTASSGDGALEIVQTPAQRIDLLISDVVMPGTGGRELVWRVREIRPALPIILASGYAAAEGALQMMEDQDVVFVPKPVELPDLMRMVQERIGRAGASDPVRRVI